MKTKICTKCGKRKLFKYFYHHKRQKGNYSSQCKKCVNDYFKNNKEKVKKYKQEYYLKNKEKHNEQSLINYQKNKKERNIKQLIYEKKRRKIDIRFRLMGSLRTRVNSAITKGYKSLSTMFLIGCEVDYLMYHIQNQFTKGMSWDNYGIGGWEMDHIKPLCLFNLKNKEEQRNALNYTNLQPLWAIDNRRKYNKYENTNF